LGRSFLHPPPPPVIATSTKSYEPGRYSPPVEVRPRPSKTLSRIRSTSWWTRGSSISSRSRGLDHPRETCVVVSPEVGVEHHGRKLYGQWRIVKASRYDGHPPLDHASNR